MGVRLERSARRAAITLTHHPPNRAREKGISVCVGAGLNRWAAVHRLDAAPIYRLALEKGVAGARYHAVAEEGVLLREIAEAIGQGLKIPVVSLSPEEAAGHFGWLVFLAGMDAPASSALMQERLGWRPTEKPGLLADLECSSVFQTGIYRNHLAAPRVLIRLPLLQHLKAHSIVKYLKKDVMCVKVRTSK